MKIALLSIVTQHQPSIADAERLGALVCEALGGGKPAGIVPYHKFYHSYRLEFRLPPLAPESSVPESPRQTNRPCCPWSACYNGDTDEVELIFSDDVNARFQQEAYRAVRWANWAIDEAKT